MREAPVDAQGVARSRERLEGRLDDLRSRIVAYRVFDSPLGPILLAHSEQGVVLLEYLHGRRGLGGSRLARAHGIEAVEDGGEAEGLYRDFRAYVEGRAQRLPWALDLRLARSPFQRQVLERTAAIPYGAVVSYKRVAEDLGQPKAVRAVAQALRWNPIPDRDPVPSRDRSERAPHGIRRGRDDPEAAASHHRGRADGPGARRLRDRPRSDVRPRPRGQRVLRPELRVDRDAPVRAPDVLRLAEPRRGGRAPALHDVPPGSPSAPRGQLIPADRVLFPGFREERVSTRETEIHAVVGGQGPPVLLLHGYPQTHACWHRIAPALATRFTVVCTDLRGYGDSGRPPSDPAHRAYSKRSMAQDQLEVMARLGFDRFALVGHDRGGRVAYRLALDHPERVTRLAVLDIVPTLETWARMDRRASLGSYHWLFLAQPPDLPERLIGADPAYFLRWTLESWAGPAGRVRRAGAGRVPSRLPGPRRHPRDVRGLPGGRDGRRRGRRRRPGASSHRLSRPRPLGRARGRRAATGTRSPSGATGRTTSRAGRSAVAISWRRRRRPRPRPPSSRSSPPSPAFPGPSLAVPPFHTGAGPVSQRARDR